MTSAVQTAEKQEKANAVPDVGTTAADGSVYAGRLPGTNMLIYAMPADAEVTEVFNKSSLYYKLRTVGEFFEAKLKPEIETAATYPAHLNAAQAMGHNDWMLPSRAVLHVLEQNQDKGDLKGTFNGKGGEFSGWYWSSEGESSSMGWAERFSDGTQAALRRQNHASVRAVRLVEGPVADVEVKAEPVVGQKMEDGTVYVGDSPHTGRKMFLRRDSIASPQDTGEILKILDKANEAALGGHDDWRAPSRAEWSVIAENYKKGLLTQAGFGPADNGADFWTFISSARDYTAVTAGGNETGRKHHASLRPLRLG